MTTPPPNAPTPRLRRGPEEQRSNGRGVVIGAFLAFCALVAFVLVLVFTIGLHNNGANLPPAAPAPTTSPASAQPTGPQ